MNNSQAPAQQLMAQLAIRFAKSKQSQVYDLLKIWYSQLERGEQGLVQLFVQQYQTADLCLQVHYQQQDQAKIEEYLLGLSAELKSLAQTQINYWQDLTLES